METCKSPRTVMHHAYQLGRQLWGGFASPFSRHDFTLAQLFACLVLRETLKLSYRKAEAFLRDCDWLGDIQLAAAPDHSTLWRAFGLLCSTRKVNRALDLMVRDACEQDLLGVPKLPATIDSTCYEPHHRSDHYDRVCRKIGREKKSGVYAEKVAAAANQARSEKAKRMPKLAMAVDAGSHLILSAVARIGTGSDAPDFCPLLQRAWQRCDVRTAVAGGLRPDRPTPVTTRSRTTARRNWT